MVKRILKYIVLSLEIKLKITEGSNDLLLFHIFVEYITLQLDLKLMNKYCIKLIALDWRHTEWFSFLNHM